MLDLLTSAPVSVKFGSRTLQVGALKLRELGVLQRFIRETVPKPTVAAKAMLEFYPPEEHRELLKNAALAEANGEWPPAVGTAEGNRVLLGSPEGQRCLVAVMLRKYQPEMTEGEVDDILGGMNEEDFYVLFNIGFGEDGADPEALRAATRDRLATLARSLMDPEDAPDADAAPTSADSSTT